MRDTPAMTTAHHPPGVPEKRTRLSRAQRTAHILAASQRLFSTHPYDAIAIEDIAAEVGMSKGLLYHYFAGKRELYVATVRHVLAQMFQFTDLGPQLHAGLSAVLALFEQYPGLAKMVLRGGIGVDPEVDALLAAYRQEQLVRVYHSLGFSGDPSSSHPLVQLGLRGWFSLLEEVSLQWVVQPDVSREQVVLLLEHSLHAILTSTLPAQERVHLRLVGPDDVSESAAARTT
jgi:AcrR family transcriptional regulator